MKQIHLSPKHKKILEDLFQKHLPKVDVWAYGSRVSGQGHSASDLDLVLRGPGLQEIDSLKILDIKEALKESKIPFLVEARDWAVLPQDFHEEIKKNYVVLIKNS